jgi:hypothetical protein
MANVTAAISFEPDVLSAAKSDAAESGLSLSAWVNQAVYERHMREMLESYRDWQVRSGYFEVDYLHHQQHHVGATLASMSAPVGDIDAGAER